MSKPTLAVDNSQNSRPNRVKIGGTEPPEGDMEARITRLEEAFTRVDANLDKISSSQGRLEISQARIEERMERVMDKARDMPTEAKVNQLLNHKLTILGIVVAIAVAALPYLTSKP